MSPEWIEACSSLFRTEVRIRDLQVAMTSRYQLYQYQFFVTDTENHTRSNSQKARDDKTGELDQRKRMREQTGTTTQMDHQTILRAKQETVLRSNPTQ